MCSNIAGVDLPSTILSIGNGAFQYCMNLWDITIPSSVTSIGNYAFDWCSTLDHITIEATTVPTMGNNVFSHVGNIPVYVPCGTVAAYQGASGWSGFTNIQTYGDCRPRYDLYYVLNEANHTAEVFGSAGVGRVLIRELGSIEDLIIPSSVEYNGSNYTVTSIGDHAFYQSGLTRITIPESVTTIANSAFGQCRSLSSVVFNARNCTRMGSENNPASYPVFNSCTSLSQITIGNEVEVIPAYAFYGCSEINSITIPNAVASIGDHAFDGCSNLTSVTFNAENCTEMHPQTRLFRNCAQGSIVIGSGVRTIPPYAFFYCTNITDFVIPNTVTTIGTGAFYGCSNMTSITIPNSVTSIGSNAFATMERLSTVNYTGSLSEWCNIDFADFPANPVYFTHQLSINGTPVSGNVSITGTSEIKPWAFYGCTTITSVTVHNTIGRIGHHAFFGCSNLRSISTPAKTVGCANPTSDMPKTTSAIEYNAFAECSSLNNINLGNNLGSIGVEAFYRCSGLTSVTIPNSVTSIGRSAFEGCSNLTNVSFDAGSALNFIMSSTFMNCTNLVSITIPNGVTRIGAEAFSGCSGLTSVTIPETVTGIEYNAFDGCVSLRSIIIPRSVNVVGVDAFNDCRNLTVFDLSNIDDDDLMGGLQSNNLKRVVRCSNYGTRENAIHQIPDTFSVVSSEDGDENHIPASLIPDNFIYQDQGAWKAKNIVLVDDTCRFFSPVAFTADNATYTRTFANNNRSTLYLPFTAAKSNCDGLEVYEFANYSNGTLSFKSLEGDNVNAYTPYLVGYGLTKDGSNICSIEQPNAVFPATAEDAGAVTKVGMTFHGTMKRTDDLSNNCYGYKDGYFVQSGGHAHVNPFRCYFTDNSGSNLNSLGVDITDGDYLGIEDVDDDMEQPSIRYSNDVYDMMGRLVRKNAESLRGLPKGIYIWRGKKQIAF
ncbi:MAG: leucine-rich repeat domain-containing protein [Bacteroidales bacterium]|nr:leucine-rich repeat domain-containing protein [Bacteroidales bacterium]